MIDNFIDPPISKVVLSVSELNKKARNLLEDSFNGVWVEGEISNLSRPQSGHIYFSLKDQVSQIRCAFFRGLNQNISFQMKDGLQVKVCGNVSIYERGGDYQLIVSRLELAGEGELKLKFEQLKRTLQQEGLFDYKSKKSLPKFVQTVGIVSSPTGAVICDIISVFKRRAPFVNLVLIPTAVQGEQATSQIVQAIKLADQQNFDALIIGRGGGSLEDLWCFNEESVARAIFACNTPTVSAVGHETDVSISDFVADVRAPTPSAAAEILAPDSSNLVTQIQSLKQQLVSKISYLIRSKSLYLQSLKLVHPNEKLRQKAQYLDNLQENLKRAIHKNLTAKNNYLARLKLSLRLDNLRGNLRFYAEKSLNLNDQLKNNFKQNLQIKHQKLQVLEIKLKSNNPLSTLEKGFSVLQTKKGKVISSVNQTKIGQALDVRLKDGNLTVRVERNGLEQVNLTLFD